MELRGLLALALVVAGLLGILLLVGRATAPSLPPMPTTTSLREAFTARGGEAEARRVAGIWTPDAALDCIRIAYAEREDEVEPAVSFDGRAVPPAGWVYRFNSPSKPGVLRVTLRPDGTCESELSRSQNDLTGPPLPPTILDSGEALAIVESRFGRELRGDSGRVIQIYAQATTTPALLAEEPRDPVAGRPTWQIHEIVYFGEGAKLSRADLHVNLDAVTGDVLFAIEYAGDRHRVLSADSQARPR